MDRAEKVGGALVVAGRDRPELLELGEEVLDQVARLVEILVVGTGRLAAGFGRDHGHLAGLGERLEHPRFGIERLVGDQDGGGKIEQQSVRALQVVRLSGRQRETGRVAERIDPGVDLGAQAAPAAADGFTATAFLTAPALC